MMSKKIFVSVGRLQQKATWIVTSDAHALMRERLIEVICRESIPTDRASMKKPDSCGARICPRATRSCRKAFLADRLRDTPNRLRLFEHLVVDVSQSAIGEAFAL
jgi:hypothetical protein